MEGTKKRELPRPNNIRMVEPNEEIDFFKWWCIICLKPFINLTNREMDVLAAFLRKRWELSKKISDPAILDTMSMSEDVKNKVLEECNITLQHFYVIMSTLKKKGVIINNAINPKYIPNIRSDSKYFVLQIWFKDDTILK